MKYPVGDTKGLACARRASVWVLLNALVKNNVGLSIRHCLGPSKMKNCIKWSILFGALYFFLFIWKKKDKIVHMAYEGPNPDLIKNCKMLQCWIVLYIYFYIYIQYLYYGYTIKGTLVYYLSFFFYVCVFFNYYFNLIYGVDSLGKPTCFSHFLSERERCSSKVPV